MLCVFLASLHASFQHAILPDPVSLAAAPDCKFADTRPREYVALKLDAPLTLDGNLNKAAWLAVPWTSDFVDISTATTPRLRTRSKLRWDDDFLYVAAELEEPNLWATLTEHNSVIFQDNDFEIFVDANATTWAYKEFEMNALNTTWDLVLDKPYGDGGSEHSCRVNAPPCFDMQPPLASAVRLDGSLNDPSTPSVGWSVEVALPIKQLMARNADEAQTPKPGVFWRINFSRVQWALTVNGSEYVKTPSCQSCPVPGTAAEDNWVWSPQGVIAMHNPETWAIVQFAEADVALADYEEWPARALARALYNAEHAYSKAVTGGGAQFTDDLAALDIYADPPGVLEACARQATIELGENGTTFSARLGNVAGPEAIMAQVNSSRFTTVTQRSRIQPTNVLVSHAHSR